MASLVGDIDCDPERLLLPDQPPEALQLVAFVADQLSVEDSPFVIDAGLADSETVGGAADTVTVTDLLVVPPDPEQLSE